jgi:hypothetical protein
MAKSFNAKILDNTLGHAVNLQRLAPTIQQQVLANLYDMVADITNQIRSLGDGSPTRVARLNQYLKVIQKTINTAYDGATDVLTDQLKEVAAVTNSRVINKLNDMFKADLAQPAFTPAELTRTADDFLIRGAPSADWWSKQADDTAMRFTTQIRMGYLQGETVDQMIQRIRGKATGGFSTITMPDGSERHVRTFSGGIMDVSTREAAALVRTSIQTISNQVLMDTYKENDDLMNGTQAIATLDGRTTELCMMRDGCAWDNDGNPLPESTLQIPFPGPPPWHWNCRTVLAPIVKSWEQLINSAGKMKVKLDDVPESTRASMDGQVSETTTYEDWLKSKPVEFQKEALGPGKYEMWKNDKLTFAQMVDQTGNPMTLAELQAKYGNSASDE